MSKTGGPDREHLRSRLVLQLLGAGRITSADLERETPLISSGLIDSVALFNLAIWVEEQVGGPIDLTQITLPSQWDSVTRILDFIERSRVGSR